jgi:hypothetical protein
LFRILKPETGISKSGPARLLKVTGHAQAVVELSFTGIPAPVIEIISALLVAIGNDSSRDSVARPDGSVIELDLAIANRNCIVVEPVIAGSSDSHCHRSGGNRYLRRLFAIEPRDIKDSRTVQHLD